MSSKLDKSVIVAGLVASIFTMLVKKVREAGGNDEDIHRLATPDGETLLGKMADLVVSSKRQVFKILVDFRKTLQEAIQAGKYDWVNSDITQDHFPVQGGVQKEVEAVLFHFNRIVTSDQAISEMEKQGFRPATIEELLALGASYPELQKQFPILALGSVWRHPSGSLYVPYLAWRGCGRDLHLHWLGHVWGGHCRFVALRK